MKETLNKEEERRCPNDPREEQKRTEKKILFKQNYASATGTDASAGNEADCCFTKRRSTSKAAAVIVWFSVTLRCDKLHGCNSTALVS
ncbi:hypothetical protein BgiBS90_018598 [Biomphalaria glabrata]|nr:hypothetical protein BgiBS90_018598 [Biomphalaria glabrata]